MWILPTPVDNSTLWSTLKSNDLFILQKYKEAESTQTLLKNVWATFQNVYIIL